MRDHHGNEIPKARHSRAEIKAMMRGSYRNDGLRRVHPREYTPAWTHMEDRNLTIEEQIGFDLEAIHKMGS